MSVSLRIRRAVGWLLLGLLIAAPMSRAGDEAAELQALLAELRELREAKYRLRQEWATEQARTAQAMATAQARRDAAAADATAQAAALEAETARLDLIRSVHADSTWDGLEQWLATLPESAQARAATQAILLDEAYLAGVPTDPSVPLPARVAQALSNEESALQRAHSVDVSRRSVEVTDGGATATFDCEVLRLGGAIEYYVTADNGRCGYRLADGVWHSLPATHGPAIRQAIQVLRREVTPTLVTLPLPPASGEAAP